MNVGRNGHVQYKHIEHPETLDELHEAIHQFETNLNKTKGMNQDLLYLEGWYQAILQSPALSSNPSLIDEMYKKIAFTRDIRRGRGLTTLSYMMVKTWHDVFGSGGEDLIQSFVIATKKDGIPCGCWKDIKQFCHYAKTRGWPPHHPVILFAVQRMNQQIREDESTSPPSWASKWVPREGSKMNWLFEMLVEDSFSHYFKTSSRNPESRKRAWSKAKREYRKKITALSSSLPILERYQCEGRWDEIDFEQISHRAVFKQFGALINQHGNQKPARELCQLRFQEYIETHIPLFTTTIHLDEIVASAFQSIDKVDKTKSVYLNALWKSVPTPTPNLVLPMQSQYMIPCIDVSQHIQDDRMRNTALGIGLKLAEQSALGPYVLLWSESPVFLDLSPYTTFMEKMEYVKQHCLPLTSNIYRAMDRIIESISLASLNKEDTKNLVVVLLSDMQVEPSPSLLPFNDVWKKTYAGQGMPNQTPTPTLLFWNVGTNHGSPYEKLK